MTPHLNRAVAACCGLLLLAGCSTYSQKEFGRYGTSDVRARPVESSISTRTTGAVARRTSANSMFALNNSPFVREQLQFSRVRAARDATEDSIQALFRRQKISYPAAEVYLRVFKHERSLELWVRSVDKKRFELLRTYPVCALAGVLGPKRMRGDGQVPEGFYYIDLFNPNSQYHLSMRVDYPNDHDRAMSKGQNLGGDIFIHGGCRSDGCIAITDQAIRELYWVAVSARGMGQEHIPVHIFPARFENQKRMAKIRQSREVAPAVMESWKTLRPGYDYFLKKQQLPPIVVDDDGDYRIAD